MKKSTHEPGVGGSSGVAINVLRGKSMNEPMDYRFAAMAYRNPRTVFGMGDQFSREAESVASQNQLAQMANLQGFQDYARASGPGTRYEQMIEAQQQRMRDDAREREQYAQTQQREQNQYNLNLNRRNDGLMGPEAEDARRFDARLELLRSIMSGQGGWGMPQAPSQPGDDGSNALAKFIRQRIGY